MLLLAILPRLALLLTPGYDVPDFQVWAQVVDEVGIGRAYSADYPPPVHWYNYPPLYLYVLRATGALYATFRPDGAWSGQVLAALLKISPIVAELVLGFLLYRFLRRHSSPPLALGGTAAYLLNPAIIWNTAYWGGIDALHALFLTAALLATAEQGPTRAWPLATLAIGTKLLALPGALATVPTALRRDSPCRLLLAALGALATGALLAAPLLLREQSGALVRAMFRNLGDSAVASANAHNLWWLITWGHGWRADTRILALDLNYRQVGLILFVCCAAWVTRDLWRSAPEATRICGAGAFLTFAFFILTTEVHENWSFALFAPLAVAATLHPPHRRLYAALSLTCLANLALHDPPLRDLLGRGFDGTARTLGLLNAAAQCAIFGWWARTLSDG